MSKDLYAGMKYIKASGDTTNLSGTLAMAELTAKTLAEAIGAAMLTGNQATIPYWITKQAECQAFIEWAETAEDQPAPPNAIVKIDGQYIFKAAESELEFARYVVGAFGHLIKNELTPWSDFATLIEAHYENERTQHIANRIRNQLL